MSVRGFAALAAIVTVVGVSAPASAQTLGASARDYPYCAKGVSSESKNCYVRSLAECPTFQICVANPWYVGANARAGGAEVDRASARRRYQ
jgi:hypothetical protein